MKRALIAALAVAAFVVAGAALPYEDICNKPLSWGFARSKTPGVPPVWKGGDFDLATYNAYYLGDVDKKVVYLTFDNGYENGFTAPILDVLRDKGVPAAFFVTKPYLRENKDLVARMMAEGHIVGNHTVRHKSSPALSPSELALELSGVADYFKENFGVQMPKFFRPPMGEFSRRVLAVAQDEGYATIFWSFAYVDWKTDNQPGAAYALKRVMSDLHNGAILLLHAVSSSNAEAMADIIDAVRAAGFEFRCLYHLTDNFGRQLLLDRP
jgi:peptidoglycan-N-acetylmuramic acid deacetylase